MYNSIKLTLYTQDDCFYCKEMKRKLVEWDFDFREINVSYDMFAKDFLKQKDIARYHSFTGMIHM